MAQPPTAAHVNASVAPSVPPAPDLQEITVEQLHDAIAAVTDENISHLSSNTNNPQLPRYFCTHSNVTLHVNSTSIYHNNTKSKLLIDSGASYTLIKERYPFHTYQAWPHKDTVTLAVGITTTPILGFGTIRGVTSTGHIISINNCLHVPTLSSSLLSTKAFSLQPGHNVFTENGNTIITFPTFSIARSQNILTPVGYQGAREPTGEKIGFAEKESSRTDTRRVRRCTRVYRSS